MYVLVADVAATDIRGSIVSRQGPGPFGGIWVGRSARDAKVRLSELEM